MSVLHHGTPHSELQWPVYLSVSLFNVMQAGTNSVLADYRSLLNEWMNEQTDESGPGTIQMLAIIINICRISSQMRADCLIYLLWHRFLSSSCSPKIHPLLFLPRHLEHFPASPGHSVATWPSSHQRTWAGVMHATSHVGTTKLSTLPLSLLGKAARIATLEAIVWEGWTCPISLCPSRTIYFLF